MDYNLAYLALIDELLHRFELEILTEVHENHKKLEVKIDDCETKFNNLVEMLFGKIGIENTLNLTSNNSIREMILKRYKVHLHDTCILLLNELFENEINVLSSFKDVSPLIEKTIQEIKEEHKSIISNFGK